MTVSPAEAPGSRRDQRELVGGAAAGVRLPRCHPRSCFRIVNRRMSRRWIYVFGVLTLAALVVIVASGLVDALKGPEWWHHSGIGHYVNSMHLWSVELFFFFMVIHLWGQFFMAAWRGHRALTWMTGAIAFLASIGTAFTGYEIQSNFDSQWIATQAKDGMNAVGIGVCGNAPRSWSDAVVARGSLPAVVGAIVVFVSAVWFVGVE